MSCPLPCNSAKESGLMPERRWRSSVFWVTRNRSLPSRWSSKRERWDAFGATSPGGTRHLGAGRPASRRVPTPSGPRKSGMPESVLIPAPVKATMCSDPAIHRAIFSTWCWRGCSPVIVSATWQPDYYSSQRPSALARSTSRRPAGFILPSSISLLTLTRLTFDHLLLGRRGVNRSNQCWVSKLSAWLSIQPYHRATSRASAKETVSNPEPFLASLSHSLSEVAWCSSSHVSHASREANGIIGSLGFLVVMAFPLSRGSYPPKLRTIQWYLREARFPRLFTNLPIQEFAEGCRFSFCNISIC